MDVLRGRIMSGSVVATDKASAYVDVLAELEVAAHTAYDSKDRLEGTINRINTVHSLLSTFMEPFRGVVDEAPRCLPRLVQVVPDLHGSRFRHRRAHGRATARERRMQEPHP